MTDSIAAVLFEEFGEIIWSVRGRATLTGIRIRNLEVDVAKHLKKKYRGSTTLRHQNGQSLWTVYGRDSDLFAEIIEGRLLDSKKKGLLKRYIQYRHVIGAAGRGRGSTLDEKDLDFRREIEDLFKTLQNKESSDE